MCVLGLERFWTPSYRLGVFGRSVPRDSDLPARVLQFSSQKFRIWQRHAVVRHHRFAG